MSAFVKDVDMHYQLLVTVVHMSAFVKDVDMPHQLLVIDVHTSTSGASGRCTQLLVINVDTCQLLVIGVHTSAAK